MVLLTWVEQREVLDLPLVNSAGWKGTDFIVANILAHKSARWDKLLNYTSEPLNKACGC